MKLPNAEYIGQVAVFYIPTAKLDIGNPPGHEDLPNVTARMLLHGYFVKNFNAYTHEVSKISGYWVNKEKDILVTDEHERYEVSFKGREKVKEFVTFLSKICGLIGEDSIYLTMGYKSWLVVPPS